MTLLDQTAAALLGTLGAAALKATLLLTLIAGAVGLFRRQSAALKHTIWTMGLGATLALLALPAIVPAWRVIPTPALGLWGSRAIATRGAAAPADEDVVIDDYAAKSGGSVLRFASNPRGTLAERSHAARLITDHWPTILAALWLCGTFLVVARHVFSVVSLGGLSRRASLLDDAAGAALGRRLATDLGIRRAVTFLSGDEIQLPLTWGLIRPRVVLPGHASDWSGDRLQHVLQHELAHVTRLDAGTQLVASSACALFWFHPLVWHASHRMRHERERACDDRVLARGAVPSAYATDLLALVEASGAIEPHRRAALAMARGSTLEGRLIALLDPAVERGAAKARHVAITLLLATLFVVPAAALRAVSPPSSTPATSTAPAATRRLAPALDSATLTLARTARPLARPTDASRTAHIGDLFDGCAGGHASHVDDDRSPSDGRTLRTVSARSGDCRGTLVAHGDITFNRDVTGFERISDEGDVDITATIRVDTTHLVARASAAGAMTYTFTRNGQPADFGADGRAWLASFLTTLDRYTAFAVEQRLPQLLDAGGASIALDEIDRMRTEHARMAYLVALGETAALADGDLDRAMAIVTRFTSDHARLEVLVTLARRSRFEGARLDAYLTAAAALQSVGERRRALTAINRR